MRTAWCLLIVASCAPAATKPAVVPAPELVHAAATLTIEPGEEPPRPEGAPPATPELTTADLVAELRAPAAREAALTLTGQPRTSEVSVREDGRMIEFAITSTTGDGAIAVCNALVRGAAERAETGTFGGYFAAERGRLERELVELSRSLALLPDATGVSGSRAAALMAARSVRVEAEVGETAMLVALRRMLLVAQFVDERRRLGAAHPDRAMSAARVSAIEAALVRQKATERAEATSVAALVAALPAKAPADVTGRALAERLRRLPIERITSVDARELEDLALAHIDARAEEAALATRYGEAHPRRLELESRLRRIEATYERRRDTMVYMLEQGALPVDVRRDDVDDRARRLAIALARLDDWASTRRPARVATVASCRVVNP